MGSQQKFLSTYVFASTAVFLKVYSKNNLSGITSATCYKFKYLGPIPGPANWNSLEVDPGIGNLKVSEDILFAK